jgi:hypothetical protein
MKMMIEFERRKGGLRTVRFGHVRKFAGPEDPQAVIHGGLSAAHYRSFVQMLIHG